ncbi:MAG: helix-turn-helix domain-containing protein [Pseudonocardiaceae bacterium]
MLRRQGLAQRRKAVGLTQEALAQRLGVERSTVVRWEAGDTEPLPSIRPHVAHALQVSLDQLAELLTEDENAGTTRALPVDTDVTLPVVLPAVPPSRDECEDLVPPEVTEAFEALRGALRSAGVSPKDVDATLLIGKSSPDATGGDVATGTLVPITTEAGELARSDLPEPTRTEVLRRPFLTAIPLDVEPADAQRRRATSRRFKRFAAAGILVVIFAGGAASVPFTAPRSAPIPPAGAGNPLSPAPEAAIPAPSAGSGHGDSPHPEGSTEAIHSAPADAPGTPAGDPAPPAAAAVPAPHTIRASNPKRPASRPKPPGSAATPPAPRTPAIPAEAYAWSEMAAATAGDHRRARVRPEAPPHP